MTAVASPFAPGKHRLIALAGTSGDHFCVADGRLQRPDAYLYTHLREAGYAHVCFVSHDRVYFPDVASERAIMAPPARPGRRTAASGLVAAPGGLTLRRRTPEDPAGFTPRGFYRGLQDTPQDLAQTLKRALRQSEHATAVVIHATSYVFEEALGATRQMNLLRNVLMLDFEEHGGPDNKNVVIFRFPYNSRSELADALRTRTGLAWVYGLDDNGAEVGAAHLVSLGPAGRDEVRTLIDRAFLKDGLEVAWAQRDALEVALTAYLRTNGLPLRVLATWLSDLPRLDGAAVAALTGERPTTDLWQELDALVGIAPVKAWFERRRKVAELYRSLTAAEVLRGDDERRASYVERLVPRLRPGRKNLAMTFTGNPGLGKTTVAHLAGRLLRECGELPIGHVVKVTRADLVAGYAGQSALKTRDAIERAVGGVLFLDEAYDLCRGPDDAFGTEALTTLLEAISDRQGELAFIFAGYPADIARLLGENSGLSRRFPEANRLVFPDATPASLAEAFTRMVAARPEVTDIAPALRERLVTFCQALPDRHEPGFGNYGRIAEIVQDAVERAFERGSVVLEARDLPPALQPLVDAPPTTAGGVLAELDDLIGLASVKTEIEGLTSELLVERQRGGDKPPVAGHFLFVGRPGSGKTTVARIMARQLYAIGCIERPVVTECTAMALIGRYLGETSNKTQEFLQRGLGGVIFIDEAHQLYDPRFQHQGYGTEALRTLVPFLENERERCVVILAGYPDAIDAMLTFDAGLSGRFGTRLVFEDYDADEMLLIFERFCRDHASGALSLTDPARERLRGVLATLPVREGGQFKNGRSVRNLFQQTLRRLARRLRAAAGAGPLSREALVTIEACDIPE